MQAVIQTGGKQYTVQKGQRLFVEKLDAEVGKEVELDVLAVLGEKPLFGTPLVENAKVVTQVVNHLKDDKVVVYKYKRRKGYHKKQGHRQWLTEIEVKEIRV